MLFKKIISVFLGLTIYAVGLVLIVQTNLGVTPWDTLHLGITEQTGISLGYVIIITGVLLLLINLCAKERIGIGTLINMSCFGLIVNLLMNHQLVPSNTPFLLRILLFILGLFVIAFGTKLYVGAGIGSGPRDGLIVILMKFTQRPIGLVRSCIELTVIMLGAMLGANIGIGTLLGALLLGPICQWTFYMLNFDIAKVEHEYL